MPHHLRGRLIRVDLAVHVLLLQREVLRDIVFATALVSVDFLRIGLERLGIPKHALVEGVDVFDFDGISEYDEPGGGEGVDGFEEVEWREVAGVSFFVGESDDLWSVGDGWDF